MTTLQRNEQSTYTNNFFSYAQTESDKIINYFLAGFFTIGLLLAFAYNTWIVAISVGGFSLFTYYFIKMALPQSNLYQYVLSAVFGIFMAQYLYQSHGMFEMNFVALIGSAILVTYQNWKLQFPLVFVVVIHHVLFAYLQSHGFELYFPQFEHMSVPAILLRAVFASLSLFICGFWAYRFRKYSEKNIEQSYEIGRLGEEKLQKETLRQSEVQFRELFETAPEAIGVFDLDTGKFVDCNSNFLKYFKLSREEMLKKSPADISPEFQPDGLSSFSKAMEMVDRAMAGNPPVFEWIHEDAQGRQFPCEVRLIKVSAPGRNLIRSSVIDISEKKRTEQKLAEANHELGLLFNNIQDVLFSIDVKSNRLANISPASTIVYGYTPAEFYANQELWKQVIHPEDKPLLRGKFKPLFNGKAGKIQYRVIHKDGSTRWIENHIIPTLNAGNEVVRFVGITRDITEKIKAEIEITDLNASLERKVQERTEQLEAAVKELEAFSYSVSHDLRAPLRVINGFGKLLMRKYDGKLDRDAVETLQAIVGNAKRMGQLIDDLLDFSRLGKTPIVKNEVDMVEMVKSVVAETLSVEPVNSAAINVRDLKPALCDPSLIKQVWVNLVSNAVKYSRKKDKPEIEIGTIGENGHTTYYVKDNGAGFDMEHSDKLFGVFQRLHKMQEYEGTGVGLALVKRIINKHGGKIWAEGKVDQGATFYFTLPDLKMEENSFYEKSYNGDSPRGG